MKIILSVKTFFRGKVFIREILFVNFNYRVCGFRVIFDEGFMNIGNRKLLYNKWEKKEEYIIMNFENNKRRLIKEN